MSRKGISASSRKAKGNKFEIDTARSLSLWMSDGADKSMFWRSSDSGAGATFATRQGNSDRAKLDPGDVSARSLGAFEFLSAFFVECKHQKFGGEQGVSRVLYGHKNPGNIFWDDPYRKAVELRKQLFSVWKVDRRPPMLSVALPTWELLDRAAGGKLMRYFVLYRNPLNTQEHQVHTTEFVHFCEVVRWKSLRRILHKEGLVEGADH